VNKISLALSAIFGFLFDDVGRKLEILSFCLFRDVNRKTGVDLTPHPIWGWLLSIPLGIHHPRGYTSLRYPKGYILGYALGYTLEYSKQPSSGYDPKDGTLLIT